MEKPPSYEQANDTGKSLVNIWKKEIEQSSNVKIQTLCDEMIQRIDKFVKKGEAVFSICIVDAKSCTKIFPSDPDSPDNIINTFEKPYENMGTRLNENDFLNFFMKYFYNRTGLCLAEDATVDMYPSRPSVVFNIKIPVN